MQQAWLDELQEFIAIPSVSADPAHRDDVRRAGEWFAELVKRAGGEAELVPFGERELVLGDIPATRGGGDAPTVLVYGHFDVQPPAPLDEWQSSPFELEVRDGWAYGRGVADDKGLLYTVVKAAELLVHDGENLGGRWQKLLRPDDLVDGGIERGQAQALDRIDLLDQQIDVDVWVTRCARWKAAHEQSDALADHLDAQSPIRRLRIVVTVGRIEQILRLFAAGQDRAVVVTDERDPRR